MLIEGSSEGFLDEVACEKSHRVTLLALGKHCPSLLFYSNKPILRCVLTRVSKISGVSGAPLAAGMFPRCWEVVPDPAGGLPWCWGRDRLQSSLRGGRPTILDSSYQQYVKVGLILVVQVNV